ncbi:hypothetical protein [Mucilaginibacter gracilis]|uniref:hypothetical protein n=1 Tax=Mucilaginibacter gracilis TaxID=423350 RepID=UPI0011C414F5|nr:hypothetical protein [Mucilaginibacter gracilis]
MTSDFHNMIGSSDAIAEFFNKQARELRRFSSIYDTLFPYCGIIFQLLLKSSLVTQYGCSCQFRHGG